MLIQSLRNHTSAQHTDLDQFISSYLDNLDSIEGYIQLLKGFYGFIKPLHSSILSVIDRTLLPDMNSRRGAEPILQDLKELGFTKSIEPCKDLPEIHNHATALGALYVLEGSTLGGRIITRKLKEVLGTGIPVHFFSGYNAETGIMWKQFMEYLEDEKNNVDPEASSKTAAQTFSKFHNWLQKELLIYK